MQSKQGPISAYKIHRSTALLTVRLIVLQIVIMFIHLLGANLLEAGWQNLGPDLVTLAPRLGLLIDLANIIILAYLVLQWSYEYYMIQPSRIILKQGIIFTREYEYAIEAIQSVGVEQGFWGKILGFGTVKLYNPVLKEELVMSEISNPFEYAQMLEELHPKQEVLQFFPKTKRSI